jgi:UDPglucose 6-dehydrogenase
MNVCVIGGAGYVGLVTGLGLAELGHQVINVDINADRIRQLTDGEAPIYEEDLIPLLKRHVESRAIRFTTKINEGMKDCEIVFVAVGTPTRNDGKSDLSQVIQVAEDLDHTLNGYTVIVIKSTVPVGTVELFHSILARNHAEGEEFDLVSNPEFLREGKAIYDFLHPDRIVIGTDSDRASRAIDELYAPLIQANRDLPVIRTSVPSAQLIKYASNAFLATRVSFINEIASVCERVGADINEVTQGMGPDPRIGYSYLKAGLGFGGPCLEKDLVALINIAESNSYEPNLLRSVLERNGRQVDEVITKIKAQTGYLLYQRIITVYGLAFKAGTSDVRNSLSLKVIDRLQREGATVRAHDPVALKEAELVTTGVELFEDPYAAAENADAALILTAWPEYLELDFNRIQAKMAEPRIVDACNLLAEKPALAKGFTYSGIGTHTAAQ